MINNNCIKKRNRYSYKEKALIDLFLLINTKHILNCYFNKKNYKDWYKNLKILFPNRPLNNLKSKILKILKNKFKNYMIKLDSNLPSLKNQNQNKIIIPNKNHLKYYFKYCNEQKKKFVLNETDININFYKNFINSQEEIFSHWIKNENLNIYKPEDDLNKLYTLKNNLKKVNIDKIDKKIIDKQLIKEIFSLQKDLLNYLNNN